MAKYKGKNRWQFQPLYVKVYRWWRYIFPAWLVFLYRAFGWVIHGSPRVDVGDDDTPGWKLSRKETFGLIYRATLGIAQIKAGHYHTSGEFFQNLKDKNERHRRQDVA